MSEDALLTFHGGPRPISHRGRTMRVLPRVTLRPRSASEASEHSADPVRNHSRARLRTQVIKLIDVEKSYESAAGEPYLSDRVVHRLDQRPSVDLDRPCIPLDTISSIRYIL